MHTEYDPYAFGNWPNSNRETGPISWLNILISIIQKYSTLHVSGTSTGKLVKSSQIKNTGMLSGIL